MTNNIETAEDALQALNPPVHKRIKRGQWYQDGHVRVESREPGMLAHAVRYTARIHHAGEPEELVLLTAREVDQIRDVIEELRADNNDMLCRMRET